MGKYLLSSAAICVLCISSVSAQGKADFSGHWQLLDGNKAGSDVPRKLEIVQNKDTLEVIDTDKSITRTYKLDGSESKNEPYGKPPERALPGTYTEVSQVTWKGAALVIHTESTNGDVSGEDDKTYKLSSDRRRLTIETKATFSTGAQSERTVSYEKMDS